MKTSSKKQPGKLFKNLIDLGPFSFRIQLKTNKFSEDNVRMKLKVFILMLVTLPTLVEAMVKVKVKEKVKEKEVWRGRDYYQFNPIVNVDSLVDELCQVIEAHQSITSIHGFLLKWPEHLNMPLHTAIEHADLSTVHLLLEIKASVNQSGSSYNSYSRSCHPYILGKMSPLRRAIEHRNLNIIEELLAHGATLDPSSDEEASALAFAVELYNRENIESKEHVLHIIELLLRHGANINERTKLGRTPLLLATKYHAVPVVELMVRPPADINFSRQQNKPFSVRIDTPLITAIKKDFIDIGKILLDAGADVNATGSDKTPPLALTLIKGNREFAKLLLLHNANVNIHINKPNPLQPWVVESTYTVLEQIILLRDQELIKLVTPKANLNIIGPDGLTPIARAIESKNFYLFDSLLRLGADLNIPCSSGETAFHKALTTGNYDLINTVIQHGANVTITSVDYAIKLNLDPKIISLLASKTNINQLCPDGLNPLAHAVTDGNIAGVNTLLQLGAGASVQLRNNVTALHLAVQTGNCQIIQALLARGAHVDARQNGYCAGSIPLDLACLNGNVEAIRLLLAEHLKRITDKSQLFVSLDLAIEKVSSSEIETIIRLFVQYGFTIDELSSKGYLHKTLQLQNFEAARTLINLGIDVNKIQEGTTALHIACNSAGDARFAKLLLDAHANPNILDASGRTPFDIAVAHNNLEHMKFLLRRPEFRPPQNSLQQTLRYAIERNEEDLAQIILSTGYKITREDFVEVIKDCYQNRIFKLFIKFGAFRFAPLLDQLPYFLSESNRHLTSHATEMFNEAKEGNFRKLEQHLLHVDVDTRGERNETLLHHAARHRNRVAVKKLLLLKADPTISNDDGRNPVQLAMDMGFLDIVGIFTHAATPWPEIEPKYSKYLDELTKKQEEKRKLQEKRTFDLKLHKWDIQQYINNVKSFNSKFIEVKDKARAIGLIAGASTGCSLGLYAMLKWYRTYKNAGLRQAFKQHWLKGIASGITGSLCYVAASELSASLLKRKHLIGALEQIEKEKNTLGAELGKLKELTEPHKDDMQELNSAKFQLRETIKEMELAQALH